MRTTDETHLTFTVKVREKTESQRLMGMPYLTQISAESLEGASAEKRNSIVYRNLPIRAFLDMEEELHKRNIDGVKLNREYDAPAKILSLYLRHIGLSPFTELRDPCAVIELSDKPDEGERIDVSSGVEDINCPGSPPLIPRR